MPRGSPPTPTPSPPVFATVAYYSSLVFALNQIPFIAAAMSISAQHMAILKALPAAAICAGAFMKAKDAEVRGGWWRGGGGSG